MLLLQGRVMTDLTADDILHAESDRKVGEAAVKDMARAMLERGIEPTELGRVTRMKMWQVATKNKDGEPEVSDLYGFQLAPSWDAGPEWPVVQPGPTPKFTTTKVKMKSGKSWKRAVILPDIQA